MILSIDEQIGIFVFVFMAGLISGTVYDLLEIFRMNIKHGKAMICIEDIIYWIVVIVILFLMLLDKNYAEIRFFNIAGFFAGMLVYNFILSPFVIRLLTAVIKVVKFVIKLLFEIVTTPLRLIWLIIGKPVKSAADFAKGYLKKLLHLCNYYAKINKRRISAQMRFIRRKNKTGS